MPQNNPNSRNHHLSLWRCLAAEERGVGAAGLSYYPSFFENGGRELALPRPRTNTLYLTDSPFLSGGQEQRPVAAVPGLITPKGGAAGEPADNSDNRRPRNNL